MESTKVLNKKTGQEIEERKVKTRTIFQGIAFYLEDNIFCMDIMSIKDIIVPRMTYRVPNTSEKLLGVFNLRGEILPLYSLKLILEMADPLRRMNFIEPDEDKFIITVKKDRDIFGIMVDAIYKNITATDENYREGNYLDKWSKNYLFRGVILEEDKEILVIHIDNLLKYMSSLK